MGGERRFLGRRSADIASLGPLAVHSGAVLRPARAGKTAPEVAISRLPFSDRLPRQGRLARLVGRPLGPARTSPDIALLTSVRPAVADKCVAGGGRPRAVAVAVPQLTDRPAPARLAGRPPDSHVMEMRAVGAQSASELLAGPRLGARSDAGPVASLARPARDAPPRPHLGAQGAVAAGLGQLRLEGAPAAPRPIKGARRSRPARARERARPDGPDSAIWPSIHFISFRRIVGSGDYRSVTSGCLRGHFFGAGGYISRLSKVRSMQWPCHTVQSGSLLIDIAIWSHRCRWASVCERRTRPWPYPTSTSPVLPCNTSSTY